jgi:hypothetical protein
LLNNKPSGNDSCSGTGESSSDAILYEGSDVPKPSQPALYGEYGDLPKKGGGRNTYRSTPYPQRQMILYHDESSHLPRWPRRQFFFCELPSVSGGATPIVDCREMLRQLPAQLVESFERKQLMYVRTFTRGLDVPWREFFDTDDRRTVESRCASTGVPVTC